jgi:hypothetical protein
MLKNDALVGEKKNSAGIAKESENCQGRGLDICTWLEQLKGGYSKFTPSFEEMGIGDEEDLTELHAEDIMALEQAIIEKGAEPIHLRVIRRAIDSLRNSTFTNVELATNTTGSPLSPRFTTVATIPADTWCYPWFICHARAQTTPHSSRRHQDRQPSRHH